MKSKLITALTVTLGMAALLVTPFQQVQAAPTNCNGGATVFPLMERASHQRRQLFTTYAQARQQMSQPSAPAGRDQATQQHHNSALGISWLILLVGLAALALLTKRLLAPIPGRPAYQYCRSPKRLKHSLTCALIGALLGLPLLTVAATLLASADRPAIRAATLAPSNPQTGNFNSALEIGGNGVTQIGGTAFDPAGNLYVTGGFTGQIVFNTTPQTTLTSTADYDLFVAKYNASGVCLWARVAHGATGLPEGLALDGALALAVDNQGNSFVGGGFVAQLNFKDAQGNMVATLGDDNGDINFELFVAKYDTNGNLQWARGGMSGTPDDPELQEDLDTGINGITEINLDGAGNPYVVGSFSGTSFLGAPVAVMGLTDLVIARLNPATGLPVWVRVAGSVADDTATGVGIDQAGNLYLSGVMVEDTTFPTTPPTTLVVEGFPDTFLAKYDQNGQCLWVEQLSGSNTIFGEHLAVNGVGEIYLTGFFEGSATIGSDTLSEDDPQVGGFLAKLDTDGNELWARVFEAFGGRVALDGAGHPHVVGSFEGSAEFGTENSATAQLLSNQGESDKDQFIAKYDAAGNFQWAKALPGSGLDDSESLIDSESVGVTVNPSRLSYNSQAGTLHVSGDFSGTLTLDALSLVTTNTNRHGFVAALCPTITLPAALPNAAAGVTYNQALAALPAVSYTYSLTQGSLPPGFSLNGSSGALSGVSSTIGTYSFTIRAVQANGCSGSQAYTLDITCPSLALNPVTLAHGAVGAAYNQTLTATPAGGNYNYAVSAGALPPGLSLNAATGVISGTPTMTGTFGMTIRATGFGSCQGSRHYTITIGNGGCPAITLPASLPNGKVGQVYSQSVAASPSGSYSYSLSGTAPPGVPFYNSAALLYGYPSAPGSYSFTITASNASGCQGSRAYLVTISSGATAAQRPIIIPPASRVTPERLR